MIGKRIFLAAALILFILALVCLLGTVVFLLLLRPLLTVLSFFGFVVFLGLAIIAGVIWLILRIIPP
jgi:hypothetical protein